jgi:hypothetical protein
MFPNLNDGVGVEYTVGLQGILPLPVMDIAKFCRDSGITPQLFTRTVWLIVLRPFLEADRVCIGYRDRRDRTPEPTSGPAEVIQSDILPDASVLEVLKSGLRAKPEPLCHEQLPAHNTAVALIQEIAGSDRSQFMKEVRNEDCLGGHKLGELEC